MTSNNNNLQISISIRATVTKRWRLRVGGRQRAREDGKSLQGDGGGGRSRPASRNRCSWPPSAMSCARHCTGIIGNLDLLQTRRCRKGRSAGPMR
ncbi:hypothetical protein M8494_04590 [Serratia ureilytica]